MSTAFRNENGREDEPPAHAWTDCKGWTKRAKKIAVAEQPRRLLLAPTRRFEVGEGRLQAILDVLGQFLFLRQVAAEVCGALVDESQQRGLELLHPVEGDVVEVALGPGVD